jgi:hypothetical protein
MTTNNNIERLLKAQPPTQHREFGTGMQAIDGISDASLGFDHSGMKADDRTFAIRSDVMKIILMDNNDFEEWYDNRKKVTVELLEKYDLVGDIPALNYGRESQKNTLNCHNSINSMISTLKEGLKYLDGIKRVRNEYRSDYGISDPK